MLRESENRSCILTPKLADAGRPLESLFWLTAAALLVLLHFG
jgi:hypothetical protein